MAAWMTKGVHRVAGGGSLPNTGHPHQVDAIVRPRPHAAVNARRHGGVATTGTTTTTIVSLAPVPLDEARRAAPPPISQRRRFADPPGGGDDVPGSASVPPPPAPNGTKERGEEGGGGGDARGRDLWASPPHTDGQPTTKLPMSAVVSMFSPDARALPLPNAASPLPSNQSPYLHPYSIARYAAASRHLHQGPGSDQEAHALSLAAAAGARASSSPQAAVTQRVTPYSAVRLSNEAAALSADPPGALPSCPPPPPVVDAAFVGGPIAKRDALLARINFISRRILHTTQAVLQRVLEGRELAALDAMTSGAATRHPPSNRPPHVLSHMRGAAATTTSTIEPPTFSSEVETLLARALHLQAAAVPPLGAATTTHGGSTMPHGQSARQLFPEGITGPLRRQPVATPLRALPMAGSLPSAAASHPPPTVVSLTPGERRRPAAAMNASASLPQPPWGSPIALIRRQLRHHQEKRHVDHVADAESFAAASRRFGLFHAASSPPSGLASSTPPVGKELQSVAVRPFAAGGGALRGGTNGTGESSAPPAAPGTRTAPGSSAVTQIEGRCNASKAIKLRFHAAHPLGTAGGGSLGAPPQRQQAAAVDDSPVPQRPPPPSLPSLPLVDVTAQKPQEPLRSTSLFLPPTGGGRNCAGEGSVPRERSSVPSLMNLLDALAMPTEQGTLVVRTPPGDAPFQPAAASLRRRRAGSTGLSTLARLPSLSRISTGGDFLLTSSSAGGVKVEDDVVLLSVFAEDGVTVTFSAVASCPPAQVSCVATVTCLDADLVDFPIVLRYDSASWKDKLATLVR